MSVDSPIVPAVDAEAATRKRAMFIVFLVVFIDLLGFGIVLPLLPRYTSSFLGDFSPTGKGLIIGGLYSSFSLMQFFFSPMWGRVSDRIGRRPVLLVGLAGSVVFYALFGYASSLPGAEVALALALLFAARIGAGIAGASVGTAAAVIADCTTPEKRGKGMALIGAAFGIGFTFGPLIAYASLKFLDKQPWAPGAAASALSAVALILAAILMPETLKPGPKPPREFFSFKRTITVLRTPVVGLIVLVYFLVIFAFANFEATLALLTKEAFGMEDEDNFLVFAFIGFVLMVVQGGIYRPLSQRRPEAYWLKLGVLFLIAGLGGVAANAIGSGLMKEAGGPGLSSNMQWLFYFSVAVAVTGFAFVNPSASALISRRAPANRQGEVLGVNQSFAALGRILGPFLGSLLFFQSSSHALPYILAVVVLGGVLVLLPGIPTEPKPTA